MKKRNLLFLSITIILLTGCGTIFESIVWNDSIPEKDTATIYWIFYGGNVIPVSYNEIPVDWNIKGGGWTPLKLPSGKITFGLKGQTTSASFRYYFEGVKFSYNFESGKEYTVYAQYDCMHIHAGRSYSKDTLIEKIQFNFK